MQELKSDTHQYKKFVQLDIHLTAKVSNYYVAVISQEVHIVDDLKAKMLIEMNILVLKLILLNILKQKIIIKSYDNIKVLITITTQLINQTNQIITAQKHTVISSQKYSIILINKSNLSQNQNLLFESDCHYMSAAVYTHIINHNLSEIHIHNDLNKSLIISQKICIKYMIKYEVNECYLISSDNSVLVINENISTNNIRLSFKELLVLTADISLSEIKLLNDIIIYSEEEINIKQIKIIIADYFQL